MVKLGKPAHPERYRSRYAGNGREITNVRARGKNLKAENRGCAFIIFAVVGGCGLLTALGTMKGWI